MSTSSLSIGSSAKYPLYCKALKLLIKQGKQAEPTLCWDRLRVARSLPGNTNLLILMLMIQAEFSSVTDA